MAYPNILFHKVDMHFMFYFNSFGTIGTGGDGFIPGPSNPSGPTGPTAPPQPKPTGPPTTTKSMRDQSKGDIISPSTHIRPEVPEFPVDIKNPLYNDINKTACFSRPLPVTNQINLNVAEVYEKFKTPLQDNLLYLKTRPQAVRWDYIYLTGLFDRFWTLHFFLFL